METMISRKRVVVTTKKEVVIYFLFLFLIAIVWALNQENTLSLTQKLEEGKTESRQSFMIETKQLEPEKVISCRDLERHAYTDSYPPR